MSVLIGDNPATFESYLFYGGTVELRYNDHEHRYYRVMGNRLIPQESVTTIVKIPDKSMMLIPWACKVMSEKLIGQLPVIMTKRGQLIVSTMTYEQMFALVMDAKGAHKEKLDEAADIGKAAHGFLERHILFELGRLAEAPIQPTDPQVISCVEGAFQWMDAHNVRWLQTERKVCSLRWGYAGTMDGLCLCDSCSDPLCCPTPYKDRLSLVDFKSSNFLYVNYLMQTAGYVAALHEEWEFSGTILRPIEDRWLIRMAKKPEDSPKLFETWHMGIEDFDRDFAAFLVCLDLTRTMKDLQARMDEIVDLRRAHEKKKKTELRTEQKMKDCGKKDYKGSRSAKPKCVDGLPCAKCLRIWLTNHPTPVVE